MKIPFFFTCLLILASFQLASAATGDADAGFVPTIDKEVTSIALQADGKILIGGEFGTVNGVTRSRLARLNDDGTLDTTFNPGPNAAVYCSAVQQDGNIVLGGDFTSLGGVARNRIARVTSTGALDANFNPNLNGIVRVVLVQPDGRIVIGGDFTQVGTTARNRMARLNADGTLDTTFNPDVNATVYSAALQSDGKVVIAGSFTSVSGTRRNHVARLSALGALEGSFNVNVSTGLFTAVYCTAIQADGKILIGGSFNAIGAATRNRMARLNANGSLDAGFQPDVDSWVNAIAVQSDGKIVIAGFFNLVNGATRNHLARLDTAGATDPGFIANTDDHVYSLAMEGDGQIIAGGLFANAAGAARARLARIDNDAATETLSVLTASRIQWLRGGAGPEAQAVRFDVSANGGVSWSPLGFAKRIAGGWEFNGGAVPATSMVRGRAVVSSGIGNGSSGLVQTVNNVSLPTTVTQAATNLAATQATLNGTVNARGTDRAVTFEYGTTTAYGTVVAGVPGTATGNGVTAVSADIAGLLPHTRYHYRVVASSAAGGNAGANMTFVTGNRAPAAITDTVAVLPGAVVTIAVTDNDTDADGDTLSITGFTQPGTAGRVTRVGNTLVFTAAAGFAGGTFNYTIADGFGGTSAAVVNLPLGTLAIDPATKTVTSAPATYTITVTAAGHWSASETLPWASVAPSAAVNDGMVTVTVQANTAKAARTGKIKIGGREHTLTQQGVVQPTVMAPGVIPAGLVGAPYTVTVPTTNFPVTYTVTKMPPGLKINNATGVISGVPTAAGTYAMTLKAANAAGSSATINFTIVIDPLSARVIGTFHGSVEADPEINGNLGSRFELTTTATGSYTGRIISGAVAQSIAGKLVAVVGDPTHPKVQLSLPRAGKTALDLDLTLDGTTDALAGTLDDGLGNAVLVDAWRNGWNALNPASDFKTLHSFVLEQPNGNPALPGGHGYGSFTVKESTGVLTVAGRLADGNTLTTSTFIGQQGQVLLYQSLYGGRGSFSGVLAVTAGATPADNTIAGAATWFKKPSPASAGDLVYPAGFGPLPITVEGAAYPVPPPGGVVMGLPNVANKAMLDFSGGGLEDEGKEFDITFSLLNPAANGLTNKATFPAGAGNPNKVAMPTVNFATGAFSGEFTIPDATPALSRKVAFQGQIVKRPGGIMGYGFGLLPKLPVPPQTVSSTQKRSVRVELGAAP